MNPVVTHLIRNINDDEPVHIAMMVDGQWVSGDVISAARYIAEAKLDGLITEALSKSYVCLRDARTGFSAPVANPPLLCVAVDQVSAVVVNDHPGSFDPSAITTDDHAALSRIESRVRQAKSLLARVTDEKERLLRKNPDATELLITKVVALLDDIETETSAD